MSHEEPPKKENSGDFIDIESEVIGSVEGGDGKRLDKDDGVAGKTDGERLEGIRKDLVSLQTSKKNGGEKHSHGHHNEEGFNHKVEEIKKNVSMLGLGFLTMVIYGAIEGFKKGFGIGGGGGGGGGHSKPAKSKGGGGGGGHH